MDCEAVREQLDAWALGALDDAEARAVEEHLATCAACRALADEAAAAAASIGLAVPLRSAGAALKSRVMASAAVLEDIHRPRRSRIWPAAVAALVVLGVGAAAWASIMQFQVNDLEDRNAAISSDATAQAQEFDAVSARQREFQEIIETQDTVINVVLQPDARRTELLGTAVAPGSSAQCVWSREHSLGALVVSGLPQPDEGEIYKMWVVYENAPIDAGSFDVDERGNGRLIMEGIWGGGEDWGEFLGFAVTVERSPEVDTPSDRMVLASEGLR